MVSCQSRLGGQVRWQQKNRSLFLPMPKIKGLCQEGHPASYTKSNPYDLQRRPPRGTAERKKQKKKQEATNLWILGSTTRQQHQQGLHAVIRTLVLHSLLVGVLCFSLWVVSFFSPAYVCVYVCFLFQPSLDCNRCSYNRQRLWMPHRSQCPVAGLAPVQMLNGNSIPCKT